MTDNSMGADVVAALSALTDPLKDGKVNAGSRSYSFLTLSQLLTTARTTLGAHNLAVMQWPERTDDGVQVHTTLVHASGQRMDFAPLGIRCASDAQSIGSAITYARRYALAAVLGLSGADDDDGQHAVNTYAQTKDVHRGGPDPEEDERYYIGPHSAGMVASQKQKAALYAIMSELHIPKEKAAEFLHWLLVRLVSPDRPAGYILQKGDASTLIEALKGDRGIALADEFLGVLT